MTGAAGSPGDACASRRRSTSLASHVTMRLIRSGSPAPATAPQCGRSAYATSPPGRCSTTYSQTCAGEVRAARLEISVRQNVVRPDCGPPATMSRSFPRRSSAIAGCAWFAGSSASPYGTPPAPSTSLSGSEAGSGGSSGRNGGSVGNS